MVILGDEENERLISKERERKEKIIGKKADNESIGGGFQVVDF